MGDRGRGEKEIIARKVRGEVKWFNVKSGYGFLTRLDTNEDVFIHQSSIVKNNPTKFQRSVAENEEVEFDVVDGEKGLEAANVTGPNGTPVQGSPYATEKNDRYDDRGGGGGGRGFGPRRGGFGGGRRDDGRPYASEWIDRYDRNGYGGFGGGRIDDYEGGGGGFSRGYNGGGRSGGRGGFQGGYDQPMQRDYYGGGGGGRGGGYGGYRGGGGGGGRMDGGGFRDRDRSAGRGYGGRRSYDD